MTATEGNYVILAALQFDVTGDIALQEAARIAEQTPRAELHVVHAIVPSLAPERGGESTAVAVQAARAPEKLREYVDRGCAGSSLHVTAHVRTGPAVQMILQTAADLNADLLVLGARTQRTALDRLILGSVSARVLHQAGCPVLIAMPKAYAELAQNDAIEPPCPECVEHQRAAGDRTVFCERHSRARLRPHVYVPSERPRASVLAP